MFAQILNEDSQGGSLQKNENDAGSIYATRYIGCILNCFRMADAHGTMWPRILSSVTVVKQKIVLKSIVPFSKIHRNIERDVDVVTHVIGESRLCVILPHHRGTNTAEKT